MKLEVLLAEEPSDTFSKLSILWQTYQLLLKFVLAQLTLINSWRVWRSKFICIASTHQSLRWSIISSMEAITVSYSQLHLGLIYIRTSKGGSESARSYSVWTKSRKLEDRSLMLLVICTSKESSIVTSSQRTCLLMKEAPQLLVILAQPYFSRTWANISFLFTFRADTIEHLRSLLSDQIGQ